MPITSTQIASYEANVISPRSGCIGVVGTSREPVGEAE
jgi:hypothetical protein